MRSTVVAAVLLPAVLLLACGDDDEALDTGSDDPPASGAPGGGASPLFVEVAYVGGFVPFGFEFRNPPAAVVYDDGTVLAPGAVAEIFPGPALLPVMRGQVDEGTLDDLLGAAAEAGMIGGPPDVGGVEDIPIADAATARITVVVDGEAQVVEAYALDHAGMDLGLTAEQDEARARLADFVAAVNELALAAREPFVPERYRVLASAPPDAGDAAPGEPQPTEQAWPAGVPEPADGACTAVTGDAAAALGDALATANELTVWRLGDRTFSAFVRPVLPHEPDCPTEG